MLNLFGHPLVVMPVGTGKSVVIARFIQRVLTSYHGQKILQITHVQELIEQNFARLVGLWPQAPAGIYSAGLDRFDLNCPITFCGIASVNGKASLFGHVDLIIIDEAHLLSPNESSMYQKFILDLIKINPKLRVIGFTATDFRIGQGLLTEGDDALFTDNCVDMSTLENFNWFIHQGYLCRLIPRKVNFEYDLTSVRTTAGEWNNGDLQKALDNYTLTRRVLNEAISLSEGRKHWLVFASGVQHTEHVAEILNELGIKADFLHSKRKAKRKEIIDAFKREEFTALVNNGMLTTGFDDPNIDLLLILRPTKSPGLWCQILGRGTRPSYHPGMPLNTAEQRLAAIAASHKPDCLVLDFTPNSRTIGPINDLAKPKARKKGDSDKPKIVKAVMKLCPVCPTWNGSNARHCIQCGYEFPINIALTEQASTLPLIAEEKPKIIETGTVTNVSYSIHQKKQNPPCLKVSYLCGLRIINQYIHFEGRGMRTLEAYTWWKARTDIPVPLETAVALQYCNALRVPRKIIIDFTYKHPEVLDYEW